jgi:hypothetical protein
MTKISRFKKLIMFEQDTVQQSTDSRHNSAGQYWQEPNESQIGNKCTGAEGRQWDKRYSSTHS